MPQEPEKEKQELLKAYDEVERQAKEIVGPAKDTLQAAQFLCDTTPRMRIIYEATPAEALPPEEWERQKRNAESLLKTMKAMARPPAPFVPMAHAVANTANYAVESAFWCQYQEAPQTFPLQVRAAADELVLVLEKYPNVDKARAEIQRLGLDSRGGDAKHALQLLEEARASLDILATDDGAAGALLSLRACINACVAELIRRRPLSEVARTWKTKVSSLGRQCALAGLDAAHFDNLGVEAETTNDMLSAGKDKQLSRSEIHRRFSMGLLFLVSLLTSIDPTKLRP